MHMKEIGEIRRRQRKDRSNMTAIYGCYVNEKKEIITQFSKSLGMMPENEAEKYFATLRRTLGGTIGKNLLDITFETNQVVSAPEHKLLMDLRACKLKDDALRMQFFRKIMDSITMKERYLILIGCESYDVPFKSKDGQTDGSEETYTYLLCAVCPVKQTKATLHYVPEEKEFQDGNMVYTVSAPELGFLFPAFDNRATNIYNALYYNKSPKDNHQEFVSSVFHTPVAKPAFEQKQSFEALLSRSLEEDCSLEAVQNVHDQICQQIQMHKESKISEPLMIHKEQVKSALAECGVSQPHLAKFSVEFDETFGYEALLHPRNVIDNRKIEITTPDVVIKVAPDRSDLIETRVIGGIKYILIQAEEEVLVNGVSVHIEEDSALTV